MKQTAENHPVSGEKDLVLQELWQIKDSLSTSYEHNVDRLFEETRKNQIKSGRSSVNLKGNLRQ